ncbi:copper resistance protein CopC [Streptomyces sp. P17]|uniref:copper resistance CopC/CopD family protein n=1 Tax=Streptomyces sp. P17 TaxID=3074716 RepID=UPI0028F3FA0C|nr:copper resistance protein CopC [Streptomyces sp. P17]MDT9698369.1 copper resistance protein CopC [Streptomyces sp. P17]
MPTAPRRARKPLTALALIGAVLAFLLGGAGPASAHAALTGSDPADTAVLKTAPRQVTLTFTETVSLNDGSLRVLSPRNERVNEGSVEHAGGKANTVRVMLGDKLIKGTYTVSWRVISADSHPISGAFTFSIGKPSATSAVPPSGPSVDPTVSRLYGIARYTAYGGLALLIGVAGFALLCWPAALTLRLVRRLLLSGWLALIASTLVLLLLRGPYESGRGVTAVFDPSLLGPTLTGRTGTALVTRLLLATVAGLVLAPITGRLVGKAEGIHVRPIPPSVGARVTGLLLAVGLAATWAAAEHASAGLQVPVAIPVAVLHLLAMAVWLGGLLTLAFILWRTPADTTVPTSAVTRFSRLALGAVLVLTATGVYQSWRQVGSWEALSTTEYGRLLCLKVAAVVMVLTAAQFSRQWTMQPVHEPRPTPETLAVAAPKRVRVTQTVGVGSSSGDEDLPDAGSAVADSDEESSAPGAVRRSEPPVSLPEQRRRGLRRSVAAEAVLGVIVLAITTVLTGTPPSRAAAQSATAVAGVQQVPAAVATIPFDTGVPNGYGQVQITFLPGQVGENRVEALVYGADSGPVAVPEVRLTVTHRAQSVGPLDAKLVDKGGYWATDSLRIPLPGTWTLKVTVRVSDVDQVTVSENVTIRDLPPQVAGAS